MTLTSNFSDKEQKSGHGHKDVLKRAAEWFSIHSEQSMAIKYWHLLREYGFVLQELEYSNTAKMSAFDFNLIMQSFKSIDSEKMYQYPIAILKFIFYHARYGDMQLAKKRLLISNGLSVHGL